MEETNQNENLITTEKPNPQNLENPYIVVATNKQSKLSIGKGTFGICMLITVLIIGLSFISPLINFLPGLYRLVIVPIVLIPIFISLYKITRKLEFIKSKDNKNLLIYEKNYLCCWKKYQFSLEYTDIKCINYGSESGCGCNHQLSTIIIYYINPNEFDLDKSNIKNNPLKYIYKFTSCVGEYNELQLNLNIFKRYEFENKISEEIKEYTPQNNKVNQRIIFFGGNSKKDEQFIKLSDNFDSFFTFDYLMNSSSSDKFERIDWVYSNNFDRIFIGVVKFNNSYLHSSIYNINSIDKF